MKRIVLVVPAWNLGLDVMRTFCDRNLPQFDDRTAILFVVENTFDAKSLERNAWVLNYPKDQQVFSIPKTVNFGIRTAVEGEPDSIIVKTDADIIFSKRSISKLRDEVKEQFGLVQLCSDVSQTDGIVSCNKPWTAMPKRKDGFGACLALHATDWKALNGYDERIIGWGGDDWEMFLRASKNVKMKVSSDFPVYHVAHKSRKGSPSFPVMSEENKLHVERCKANWKNDDWGTAADVQTVTKETNLGFNIISYSKWSEKF